MFLTSPPAQSFRLPEPPLASRAISRDGHFPRITLAPACKPVNSGKTAIFLTLCDDLLWFFRQTLP
jgi:hypothetical protein